MVDGAGKVMALLAGRPREPGWEEIAARAMGLLENARAACELDDGAPQRRGVYASVNTGISYGGGQTVRWQLLTSLTYRR